MTRLILGALGCALLFTAGCERDAETRAKHVAYHTPYRDDTPAMGRPYAGATSGPRGTAEVDARVKRVSHGVVELADGAPWQRYLRIDDQTQISGGALQPGAEIRASFDVAGVESRATKIDVIAPSPSQQR